MPGTEAPDSTNGRLGKAGTITYNRSRMTRVLGLSLLLTLLPH
jgi:hypothetical protein